MPRRRTTRKHKYRSSTGCDELEPRYEALDLDLNQIRLLKILPPLRRDSLVTAELRTVRLTAEIHPSYETISYVWGDVKDTDWIRIDGKHWEVPASSVRVLRKVRLPSEPRTVWIDAICIDQNDKREREQQVTMMRQIYR
jgi:hypothetical protein